MTGETTAADPSAECDWFFLNAIEPDKKPSEADLEKIKQHRLRCPRCVQLEEDNPKLREMVRRVVAVYYPDDAPQPDVVPDAVMKAIDNLASPRSRAGLVVVVLLLILGAFVLAQMFTPLRGWLDRQSAPIEKKTEDEGVTVSLPDDTVPDGEEFLATARGKNDLAAAAKALDLFQSVKPKAKLWCRAHVGAAECLLLLGRTDEARKAAQEVLDNGKATPQEKARAREILSR